MLPLFYRFQTRHICIAVSIVLTACLIGTSAQARRWKWKVGDDYQPPRIDAPNNWGEVRTEMNLDNPVIQWWYQFNDPQLIQLIDDSIKYNYNLQIAMAHIRETRAQKTAAIGKLLPNINANAEYSRTRFSENGTSPLGRRQNSLSSGIENPTDDFKIGFDASWELDIWGTRRWQLEAAKNRIIGAEENKRGIVLSLISDVARYYVELRQAQHRLAVIRQNIALQQETVELLQRKQLSGLAAKQDVIQAQAFLNTIQSDIPNIQATIDNSAHALGVLTGRSPDALLTELAPVKSIPKAPPVIALGLPADLILRRPDIRQAERELAASSAEVASSKAQLLPTLKVNGDWKLEAINLGDILKWGSQAWSIAPSINWPIFQRLELKANVESAKARYTQRDAELRQKVLEALQDVQDSISSLDAAQEQNKSLLLAEKDTEENTRLIMTLYETGLTDYLRVLDSQRTLADLQDRRVQSDANLSLQTIRLYKALGGGWQVF